MTDPSREDPYGALAILQLTKDFEAARIPCCLVGVTALCYYGAGRVGTVRLEFCDILIHLHHTNAR